MLLMVVPAGAAAGVGDGLELLPEEAGGGAGGRVVVLGDPEVVVVEVPGADVEEGGGEELVAGMAVLASVEVLPPHPAIISRSVPEIQLFRNAWGRRRIFRL